MSNQPMQLSPSSLDRPMRISLIVGAVAAVVAVIGVFVSGPGVFFQAYLYTYLFFLGISLGSLALLCLHLAVSARWGITIRRVAEAAAGSLWLMALLFIPIVIGLPFLYPWARSAAVAASAQLKYQTWYLNTGFFILRAVILFGAWILLAWWVNRRIAQASNSPQGDLTIRTGLQGLGAGGLVFYGFSTFFASVDWIMSLQPDWISTAFGAVIALAQVMTAMAFALLILNRFPALSLGRKWNHSTTPVPYQDLGALTMTMVMAYTYVAFFQLLIQWAGNIPHEVSFYVVRLNGGWLPMIYFVAFFQFVLPFCLLLTIRVRHNLRFLAWIGGMLLVTNLVNLFWTVKPAFNAGQFVISWLDIVMPFAIGGLWLAVFFFTLKRRPALNPVDQSVLGLVPEKGSAVHEG